ncbi:MAG: MAPEG family protein [Asticcacaulis sp.]
MTYELWILVLAAILGLIQVALPPVVAASRPGYLEWNAGPRDTSFDVGPMADRLRRVFSNFMETFAIFAVIILVLALTGKTSELSVWGARLYLIGRIAYIPLYAFGVKWVRSLSWILSLTGIILCFATLFN